MEKGLGDELAPSAGRRRKLAFQGDPTWHFGKRGIGPASLRDPRLPTLPPVTRGQRGNGQTLIRPLCHPARFSGGATLPGSGRGVSGRQVVGKLSGSRRQRP